MESVEGIESPYLFVQTRLEVHVCGQSVIPILERNGIRFRVIEHFAQFLSLLGHGIVLVL